MTVVPDTVAATANPYPWNMARAAALGAALKATSKTMQTGCANENSINDTVSRAMKQASIKEEPMPNATEPTRYHGLFDAIATRVAQLAGRAGAFGLAVTAVVVWGVTGPAFHFSDTWQLVINTGTTIVTFLMVFLIQNSQNRDGAAIQVKLDELIRVSEAKNVFVGIEHLTEKELEVLRSECETRAQKNPIRHA